MGPAVTVDPRRTSSRARDARIRAWALRAPRTLRVGGTPARTIEDPRSRVRSAGLWLTTSSAAAARVVSLGVTVLTVPVLMTSLGTAAYGLWMAITSFTSFLVFSDLGLGAAIVAPLADAMARDDRQRARQLVSSGLALLALFALLGSVAALLVSLLAPWDAWLNIHSDALRPEASGLVLAVSLVTLAGMPIGLIARVQYGVQAGYRANLALLSGSVLVLITVFLGAYLDAGVALLALALGAAPLAAMLVNGVLFFRGPHRDLRPAISAVKPAGLASLLRLGIPMMAYQVLWAIGVTSDVFVANGLLGQQRAAEYAVTLRLFWFAPTLAALALTALWPAYAHALALGDSVWARRTYYRSLFGSVGLTAVVSIAFAILGGGILPLWTGGRVSPAPGLLWAMALWATIGALTWSATTLLLGMNDTKFLAMAAGPWALVSLVLSVVLGQHLGSVGIALGTSVATGALFTVPVLIRCRYMLSRPRPGVGAADDGR